MCKVRTGGSAALGSAPVCVPRALGFQRNLQLRVWGGGQREDTQS